MMLISKPAGTLDLAEAASTHSANWEACKREQSFETLRDIGSA